MGVNRNWAPLTTAPSKVLLAVVTVVLVMPICWKAAPR